MEVKLWRALYALLAELSRGARRRKREQYADAWVLAVALWAVVHDRPMRWACDTANWSPPVLDDRPLPSPSRLSRRLRSATLLDLLTRALSAASAAACAVVIPMVKAVDSKPLLVGAYSRDRRADRGRLSDRCSARGYRLHALCYGRAVRHWVLAPMSVHDSVPAPELLARLEGGWGYVTADNAYDDNDLYDLAAARGHQLVAPPRACNAGVRDTRYNGGARLRGLDLSDSPLRACGADSGLGRALHDYRETAESCFGELTGAGLNYLPVWVRGPRRVALWVAGKLLAQAARCAQRQRLTAMRQ